MLPLHPEAAEAARQKEAGAKERHRGFNLLHYNGLGSQGHAHKRALRSIRLEPGVCLLQHPCFLIRLWRTPLNGQGQPVPNMAGTAPASPPVPNMAGAAQGQPLARDGLPPILQTRWKDAAISWGGNAPSIN